MCFMHPQRSLLSLILHVYITLCGAIVCVSTTNSHTCMVVLITLSKVCAKGYATGCICMYSSQNIGCLVCCWSKKWPEKYLCCFHFAHRCRECDGWLPVHSKLSTIPTYLLMLLCLFKVVGFGGTNNRHVMTLRCSSPVLMQWLSLCWLLRLDSACSAECQQLQCSITAHVVLQVHVQCAQGLEL